MRYITVGIFRKHRKMSHVFVKTYSCHFCEELFTSEVSVMTHERIHTGIIKFECKICDFRCNRYFQMENHKKEDHGYLCSICQESFGEWAEIKNHTLSKHGGYLTSDTYTGTEGIFLALVICNRTAFAPLFASILSSSSHQTFIRTVSRVPDMAWIRVCDDAEKSVRQPLIREGRI
ncbi:zinc finger, C2H2 type [Oesophagostomum dentatum]|uniref:Zinc finger, C2H2 type n=1 Tax=Oesophagostomum dentatum TaxID=61180 RepID=A0A0B1SY42_OESDE|nr:zinc finger, C2H2 type [Oesophagostomum dentatum]